MLVMFDALVVGGGPIGGHVANLLAKNGFSVAILEEHREIGEPVQCAGIFTPHVMDMVKSRNSVLNEVRGAEIFSPSGHEIVVDGGETEAVVVDRKLFDKEIIEKSVEKGAELLLATRAIDARRSKDWVTVEVRSAGRVLELKSRLLIGADGLKSNVASWFGLSSSKRVVLGYEAEMEKVECEEEFVKVFVGNEVAPGFFAWIIPTGGSCRVGLCTTKGNPKEYFARLLRKGVSERFLREATPIYHLAGGIPIGLARRTYADNVMIVGDAASHVKATTGGGIFTGLLAAEECAKTAVEALEREDYSSSTLHRYQTRWRGTIGRELKRDWYIFKAYQKVTDRQIEEIFDLLDREEVIKLINERGEIGFSSSIGWHLVKKEPRLLKYASRAVRGLLAR